MLDPDASEYMQHMVIKTTTPSQLLIWRGPNNTVGAAMYVNWTCMER